MAKGKSVSYNPNRDYCINQNTGAVYLNPEQRGRKYCVELKTGCDAVTGKKLTQRQKSFRAGYMKARNEQVRIYNSKHKR